MEETKKKFILAVYKNRFFDLEDRVNRLLAEGYYRSEDLKVVVAGDDVIYIQAMELNE